MCTFLNTLPKKSKSAGTDKKKSLVLSMKPCPEINGQKTYYVFRLLNFAGQGTDRDYPFIERFVHTKWGKNDKGQPIIEDEVICPVTKWVDWEGNRYNDCPICRYANQQFLTLKESNWKDADARAKNREFGRKYQAIVPVYVVNDPNYEGNKGKFKVIIFNDKKVYDGFVKKVEAQLLKHNCFNGVDAADCYIHMAEVPEVRNEGQPNEYVYKNKVIDKIRFALDEKTKNIDKITKQAIDEQFPFDATYYISSTKAELEAFHKKYTSFSYAQFDDDDDEETVTVFDAPKTEPIVKKTNEVVETPVVNKNVETSDINDDELDDLISGDSDESEAPTKSTDDTNVDDLLNGLNLDD